MNAFSNKGSNYSVQSSSIGQPKRPAKRAITNGYGGPPGSNGMKKRGNSHMNGVPAFKKSSSDIPGTDIPTLNGFKYGTAGYDISGADDQVPDLRNEMILQGMLGNFDDSDSKNALYDRINELESMLVEKDEEIRTLKEDNRKIKKKAESHESKLREYV